MDYAPCSPFFMPMKNITKVKIDLVTFEVIKFKRTAGRKRIPIDQDQVFKLAQLMCTHQEIADFFDVSTDTIARHFAELIKQGREVGKISLRRKQWLMADKSAAMGIFLGKNYLDQADKIEGEGFGGDVNIFNTPRRTFVFKDLEYSGGDRGVHARESSESDCGEDEVQGA